MILNLMEEVITHSLKPIKYVVYKWHFCTRCIEWLIIKKKQVIYKHELQDACMTWKQRENYENCVPSFSWLVIFRESFCTWVSQEVSNKHQLYKVLKTKNILLSKTRQKRKTEFSEKTSGLHWIEGQVWRGDRNQGLSGGPRQASQMTPLDPTVVRHHHHHK